MHGPTCPSSIRGILAISEVSYVNRAASRQDRTQLCSMAASSQSACLAPILFSSQTPEGLDCFKQATATQDYRQQSARLRLPPPPVPSVHKCSMKFRGHSSKTRSTSGAKALMRETGHAGKDGTAHSLNAERIPLERAPIQTSLSMPDPFL